MTPWRMRMTNYRRNAGGGIGAVVSAALLLVSVSHLSKEDIPVATGCSVKTRHCWQTVDTRLWKEDRGALPLFQHYKLRCSG